MEQNERCYYDVVIVGTGAAGLFAALSLPDRLSVLMITKDELKNSDSYLAQGGICVLREPQDFDSFLEDTMKAGHYENRRDSVTVMIENSTRIMDRLVEYGVNFDTNPDGSWSYTREGAHSTFRILHHKDVTGKEITTKLLEEVQRRSNITLWDYTIMLDLITTEPSEIPWLGSYNDIDYTKESCGASASGLLAEDWKQEACCGIIAKKKGQLFAIYGKEIILATGGIGGLFQHSTNFSHLTGDSFALALRHGIYLENINYIQIHPTTLYEEKPERKFLISESVRGEGAILIDKDGNRFVDELLPRDVVTAAIRAQMEKDNMPYVRLSLTHMPAEEIKERFPNIYRHCLEVGYDLAKEPIPITPAQHYLMGGIHTDTYGRTSMQHLYAVGETACNGVHGANRLASNSLLESLVFAERAGWVINEEIDQIKHREPEVSFGAYEDVEAWQKENRELILEEIKKRDGDFYAKWCNNEN